ncbi:MAG TPA: DUF4386 family protein [Chloroflexi bacterium]|nr:DUF4386 family protein [Chloroflexota bacterium]
MDASDTSRKNILLQMAGLAGGVAALWLPLFVLLFFGLMPALGLDVNRFGDPGHVLPFFADHPVLIRLAGLVNVVGLTAAGFFGLVLARQLYPAAPGPATLGGFLTLVAWLLILVAEALDLAAYVSLPATYARDPSAAGLAFVALQTAGRMTRTWGYLLVGLGVGALGWGMSRQVGWPRGLSLLGVLGAAVGVVMFTLEYLFVTQTGDAGGGMAQVFTVLFIATGLIVTLWHAWGGMRLARGHNETSEV